MDIFTPITNAECVVPPKAGGRGRRKTYKRSMKRRGRATRRHQL